MGLSPPTARLAYCHRSGEYIYFSIGKARDFYTTLNTFKAHVPGHARLYDSVNQEWRVEARYEHVLDELFTNFSSALRDPGTLGPGSSRSLSPRTYQSSGRASHDNSKTRRRSSSSGNNWSTWLVLAVFCTGVWIWFNAGNSTSSQAQQTARSVPPAESTQISAASRSILTPTTSILTSNQAISSKITQTSISVTVLQTANLRSGPGTSYQVRNQVAKGQTVFINGQSVIPGGYSWYRLENGLWIYSQLVSGPSQKPPILSHQSLQVNRTPSRDVLTQTNTPAQVVSQPTASRTNGASVGRVKAQVNYVVDGDTIDVIINGRTYRVRYTGMDTPERGQVYYSEAKSRNAQLVQGQTVYLEKDVSETGPYGRLLRYIYLADGRMVNEILVQEGYAQMATYPPDVKYVERFRAAQSSAQSAARGMWSR